MKKIRSARDLIKSNKSLKKMVIKRIRSKRNIKQAVLKSIRGQEKIKKKAIEKIRSPVKIKTEIIKKFKAKKPITQTFLSLITDSSKKTSRKRIRTLPVKKYPLGSDLLIKVYLTREGRKALQFLGKEAIMVVSNELYKIWLGIYYQAKKWIYSLAPEETGDLRQSLLNSISPDNIILPPVNNTDIDRVRLEMRFYSDIEYAEYVNEMKQVNLRHYGNKIGRRSGRPLYDPEAERHFFQKIKSRIRRELKYKVLGFYAATSGMLGISTREMFRTNYD